MRIFVGTPSSIEDSQESPKERKLHVPRAVSSRRQDSFRVKKKSIIGEIKFQLVDKKANGSRRVRNDYDEKNRENFEHVNNHPGAGRVPKATVGEQVAAGWPSWLASAAGEAVKGWIPRKADTFEKLDKIGQGTYSSVYKARDLTNNKVVALKRVRFNHMDSESVKFMAREILILRRLDHPNIIKLEGVVTSRSSSSLCLVFEYMELDLTGLASLPGVKFTEPRVKCVKVKRYMQQLLSGLDHCHSHGILHRDIKGSNILIDSHGILKIADFGLASFYDRRQKVPLTTRVGTLWYRAPELLLGASHYGVAVDLWSTGCILAELYSGKPIMPGRTEVEQLHKIFQLCGLPSEDYWRKVKVPRSTVLKPHQPYKRRLAETFKDLPGAAVRLMETLLSIDPACRGTAAAALKSEFFRAEPFACDPSSLPKYCPSKQIDAKLREEEAKRHGALGVKGLRRDRERRGINVSIPEINAELSRPAQRKPGQCNAKSRSKLFNPYRDEAASGFTIDPPRPSQVKETCVEPPQIMRGQAKKSSELCEESPQRQDRMRWIQNLSSSFNLETGRATTRGMVEQLHKIFKLCGSLFEYCWRKVKVPHLTVPKPHQPYKGRLAETFKDLPGAAVRLMKTSLNIDPACRGTAAAALKSEFFRTEPFACDPSSLPKYPPSKEADAKLREEEAKRQGALGVKDQRSDHERREINVSVPDVNAELAWPAQGKPRRCNVKSRNELFNPRRDEAASGCPIDPPRPSQVKETCEDVSGQPPQRVHYSGPLGPGVRWTASRKKYDRKKHYDTSFVYTRPDLASLYGFVASQTLAPDDSRDKHGYSQMETAGQVKKSSELCEEPSRRQDHMRRMQNLSSSHNLESGKATTRRPGMHGNPSTGNTNYFSSKFDQKRKEQAHWIQEAARMRRTEQVKFQHTLWVSQPLRRKKN